MGTIGTLGARGSACSAEMLPGRSPPAAQQPEHAAAVQPGEAAGFEVARELVDLGEARISQPCEN